MVLKLQEFSLGNYQDQSPHCQVLKNKNSQTALPNTLYFKLSDTLPLSTCSTEILGSTINHLNNYLKSTQTEERHSSYTLIDASQDEKMNFLHMDTERTCA